MAEENKFDAPIRKEVAEAARALDTLNHLLGPVVKQLPKSVPAEKAKPAALKVHAFLKRYAPVLKVAQSSVFDRLQPDTQEGLRWLDGTMAEMLTLEAALRKAARVQEMDFAKDPEAVIKAIKVAAKSAGNPRWIPGTLAKIEKEIKIEDDKKKRTEALVKVMQKGTEIGGIPGGAISSLALLVLLYMMWKHMTAKLDAKPKLQQ
jgi:hypothetical protein